MSAIPSSSSLHEKLQTRCGSSRDKESFVLLSERNSNISAHLANFHLSKMRRYYWSRADVGKRAGIIRGDSRVWLSAWDMDVHLENFGKRKSRASTLAGKILSVAGRQVITGGVDEMIVLFGKIAAVGSRKCDYLLGCGVFFSFAVSIKVYFPFLLSQCLSS